MTEQATGIIAVAMESEELDKLQVRAASQGGRRFLALFQNSFN